MKPLLPVRRLLEIESKFHFPTSLLPRFRANQGTPPFAQLAFVRTRRFEDTYFDDVEGGKNGEGTLSRNGLWVRRRVEEEEGGENGGGRNGGGRNGGGKKVSLALLCVLVR